MDNVTNMALRIAKKRKDLGLSQEQLADKTGMSQKTISKYECGHGRPSYETLLAMSSIFNVSTDYLLGNSDLETSNVDFDAIPNNLISYWIEKREYQLENVAQQLGITKNMLLDYINNKAEIPYHVLISLSKICEVSTDCILGLVNKSRNNDLNANIPFQYNYNIAQRIKELRNPDTDTDAFLCELLSISKRELYYLIEYGFVPHIDVILKLAQHFNVSTDYLLCRIDLQVEKILKIFRHLDDDDKDILVGEIKKFLKGQKVEAIATEPPLRTAK